MAHLKSVGRLAVMYSAVSFPVYPVAPKTTASYWRSVCAMSVSVEYGGKCCVLVREGR